MARAKTKDTEPKKNRERASRGEGEIIEVQRGQVYRIRPRLGKDPKTNRYLKAPMRTVYGNKAEARRQMVIYKDELREEAMHKGRKLTVGAYARQFQDQRRSLGNLSPLTIERDEIETHKIEELFGEVGISKLTVGVINEEYAKLRTDNKVSKSQLHKLHAKLRQVLKQAVKEEIITKNPCDAIELTRPRSAERKSLTVAEATKLAKDLRKEEPSGRIVALWIGLATGIRRGEALGLSWKHVDLEHKRIYIAQQLANDLTLREPKSDNANRWIGLDDETTEYLQSWKELQRQQLADMDIEQKPNTPVVTNELGGATDPNNFSRWRRDFFADHGLGYFEHEEIYTDPSGTRHVKRSGYRGYNFHELRHTQATLLIGSGADIKTVQHRLGHSTASLTMDIYAHAIAQNDRTAADTIGETIFGNDKA
ncbi:MAG: site-specific integrase [Coriobacteriia bacterium]|nr:site-specific integrase [Coriobacteriia bacterium]MCL2750186.1 site-specific integrase [Coriobacteriia bacterium]